MNPLVMHFASGWSFYSGIVLILLSVGISLFDKNFLLKIIFRVGLVLGVFAVFSSSVPLPYLPYMIPKTSFFRSTMSFFISNSTL